MNGDIRAVGECGRFPGPPRWLRAFSCYSKVAAPFSGFNRVPARLRGYARLRVNEIVAYGIAHQLRNGVQL